MVRIAVVGFILLTQIVAQAQIAERICPETEQKREAAEQKRISDLIRARCESPWYERYKTRAVNFWDGVKAPVTMDIGYLASRVVRFGLSPESYEMLTFENLGEVLKECYPNNPARRLLFRQSLMVDDLYSWLGTATVAAAGYVTLKYTRGKLQSAGWLPLSEAAKKIGLSERWLRTIVYGAGIVGASYAWQYYNQIGEVSDLTPLDRAAGDMEELAKISQGTGTFIEEVQLNRLYDLCVRAADDADRSADALTVENRDYVCAGYRQRAAEVLAQLNEKIESCESPLPDVEKARERVSTQLVSL